MKNEKNWLERYEAPEFEVVTVATEAGFAASVEEPDAYDVLIGDMDYNKVNGWE